jgi:NAD(P)-dependent dehydrogenase (short-subunit alcohol dehydrogenase family)
MANGADMHRRVAVVTGGSGAIGGAIAVRLAPDHTVVVLDREGGRGQRELDGAIRGTKWCHVVVGVPSPKSDRYSCGEVPMCRWKAARTDAGAPSPVR